MRKPYIGITGFMSKCEVGRCLDLKLFPEWEKDADRLLMVGVLASSKTLAGRQNKYPYRYPRVREISDIFTWADTPVLNLIHYNSDTPDSLLKQLEELVLLGGESLQGFQLNMAWPLPVILEHFRRAHPKLTIVLQIGAKAIADQQASAKLIALRLSEYDGLVDYALIDASGGHGKNLNVDQARRFIEPIVAKTNIMPGVAGGLCPKTVGSLAALLRDFPMLSFDAEGRLRDEDDGLDITIAKEYLKKGLSLAQAAREVARPSPFISTSPTVSA